MESLSESKNLARVEAGLNGGPFFKTPHTPQDIEIVDGIPAESREKLNYAQPKSHPTPIDSWNERRTS